MLLVLLVVLLCQHTLIHVFPRLHKTVPQPTVKFRNEVSYSSRGDLIHQINLYNHRLTITIQVKIYY